MALIKFYYTCPMLKHQDWFAVAIGFAMIFVLSCGTPEKQASTETKDDVSVIELDYARRFTIQKQQENTILRVNTSQSESASEYLLVQEGFRANTSSGKKLITIPVRNMVVTATSHLAFMEILDGLDKVVGFPNIHYISSTKAWSRADQGQIKDVGTANGINFESLIELQPDLVVHYTSGPDNGELDQLDQSGIPYVLNYDFLEESPLGRAEWIKFMGLLIGKEKRADSVFQVIKEKYITLMNRTNTVLSKPEVFSGILYGDTWFAPGAHSFVARFIKDAGGSYSWRDRATSGSIELSLEAVLDRNINSDFWIGAGGYRSRDELNGADNRYTRFKAFQTGNIYNYHGKIGAGGGFEYFELGNVRPDIVLADFIKILHPELMKDHQLYFFKKLE